MAIRIRRSTLISQHVEVALVYRDMLGIDEALAYLARENISNDLAERILGDGRRASDIVVTLVPGGSSVTSFTVCRRRNHLHDAIIEAALKIERKLGTTWAHALLRDEKVPDEVAARILAEGPRQLRCKSKA
ncbi:hypothetical protein GCM10009094_37920 [Massilia aurea]